MDDSKQPRQRKRILGPRLRKFFGAIGAMVTWFERRPFLIFLALLGLTVTFDVLDSFGLDDVAQNAWTDVTDAVAGPLYGKSSGRIGQKNVVVVLIDDAAMAQFGKDSPPLDYRQQAQLLDDVAKYHPAVLFYDGYFPKPRVPQTPEARFAQRRGAAPVADPDVAALADKMAEIGRKLPLLIGPVADTRRLQPLRDISRDGPWRAGVHQTDLTGEPNRPRLYWRRTPGSEVGEPVLPSAAFAMYRAWCAVASRPGCAPLPEADNDPMLVRWGFGISDWRKEMLPSSVATLCSRSFWPGVWEYLERGMLRALQPDPTSDLLMGQRCGYADIVPYRDLIEQDAYGDRLRARLAGRIVVVGYDLPAGGDRRRVPFYGDVPGVLTHAMAIDNLLEMQGWPVEAPRQVWLGLDELDVLQYASTLAIVILVWLGVPRLLRMLRRHDRADHRRGLVFFVTLLGFLGFGIGIAVFGYARNWPLHAILLGGILPGGLLGLGLAILSRRSARR